MKTRALCGVVLAGLVRSVTAEVTAPAIDFSRSEPEEVLPGGDASYAGQIDRGAFSHASRNMTLEREVEFKMGDVLFRRLWATAPDGPPAADGLGPLYNARSCQSCHRGDGRGRPPAGPADRSESLVLRLSIPPTNETTSRLTDGWRPAAIPEPVYGTQLQERSIDGHRAEGRAVVYYREIPVTLADGEVVSLRQPTYSVSDPGYGPMHAQTLFSPRIAPQMIGLGLLEAVSEHDVLALADPADADGDGISGRPNRVWSKQNERFMLGRFGWKAGEPSVNDQSQKAFSHDIGISVSLLPHGAGECSERQQACRQATHGNSPEYGGLEAAPEVTDLVVFYTRNLAVPARRNHDEPQVLAGKQVFYRIGCTACHHPRFRTVDDPQNPEQSNQLIWPYTDLLLHDMGEGLADQRPEGEASGREWRTAPLWGIGLTPVVNGHTFYLHDGRARSLLEAILWHGGEAQAQRDAVARLSRADRTNLLKFVESL